MPTGKPTIPQPTRKHTQLDVRLATGFKEAKGDGGATKPGSGGGTVGALDPTAIIIDTIHVLYNTVQSRSHIWKIKLRWPTRRRYSVSMNFAFDRPPETRRAAGEA